MFSNYKNYRNAKQISGWQGLRMKRDGGISLRGGIRQVCVMAE